MDLIVSFLMQVRSSLRTLVAGALTVGSFWVIIPNDVSEVAISRFSVTNLVILGLVVSYQVGHPMGRLSSRLVDFVYRVFTRKSQTQLAALALEIAVSGLPTPLRKKVLPHVDEYDPEHANPDSVTAACKMAVWDSGSPLWALLNEREQIVTNGQFQALPFTLLVASITKAAYDQGYLSPWIVALASVLLLLVWYEALFCRSRMRRGEVGDIILSRCIVESARMADVRNTEQDESMPER